MISDPKSILRKNWAIWQVQVCIGRRLKPPEYGGTHTAAVSGKIGYRECVLGVPVISISIEL